MLTPLELHKLVRELADRRVLSVYLDTRVTDPAMRNAWKPSLTAAIRAARAEIEDESDRHEFDRAAAHLEDPLHSPGGAWAAPGWVAFVTGAGTRYAADLPVRPATIAVWRNGPLTGPYLRALKQRRPVIVALVESGTARLYRYASRELEMLVEITAPRIEEAATGPPRPSPRGSAYPAPRGAVGTEAAHRRRDVAFQRLTSELGARLSHIAGDDAWILIGGTPEWARLAADALPKGLEERVMFSDSLHHDAPDDDIKREAKSAATELRAARGKLLVDRLLERAGGHGRAAAGEIEVKRALRASAVDQLLVSPSFVHEHPEQAEDAIRSALAQGADIEMLSAGAAEHLSRAAEGIAARLRFAIQKPR